MKRRAEALLRAAVAAASLVLGVVAAPDPSRLASSEPAAPPQPTPHDQPAAPAPLPPAAPLAPAPPPAPPPPTPTPPPLARPVAVRLSPGRSAWYASTRRTAEPIGIVVDLNRQMAYVYRGAKLVGATSVSSGRRGYATPVGTFPILEKAAWHRSTKYSDAPMPFMQRLTWGGVALHAGGVPGYRQSHGCIHLPHGFARTLFGMTRIGTLVEVVRKLPAHGPAWASTEPAPRLPSTAQSAATMARLL